jgi:type II secretory pathway pseudopilin PulG
MKWNNGRRSRAGLTIIEVVVASSILLLIMAVLTAVYVRGSHVWRKVEKNTTLLRELQVVLRTLERDIATGHPIGLTPAPQALAYLSCKDQNDVPRATDRGEPIWQRFVLFYVDGVGLLRRRELPLSSPSAEPIAFEQETREPLDVYLANYPQPDDRRVTHSGKITEFSVTRTGDYGSLYEIVLKAEDQLDSDRTETVDLKTIVSVRNR